MPQLYLSQNVFVLVQCVIVFPETPSAAATLLQPGECRPSPSTRERERGRWNKNNYSPKNVEWCVVCVHGARHGAVRSSSSPIYSHRSQCESTHISILARKRVKNKLILFDDNETNLLSACV